MAGSALYQPLDKTKEEFRLLRIQPSDDFQSIITCQLFTTSLADRPSYNALSYQWGNPDITEPVLINGTRVQVTSNLESALRHIRTSHSEVILWVDALCINQHDVDEKNAQVAMMRSLYSTTISTYAWLGEDHDGSAARTFQFIRCFLGDYGSIVENIDNFAIKTSKKICSNTLFEGEGRVFQDIRSGKVSMDESNIDDFHKLCKRGYWWRTWVQQELILPPKVLLLSGSVSISLNLMIAFALLVVNTRAWAVELTEPSQTVSDMLRIRWIPQVVRLITCGSEELMTLISRLRYCGVVDPRDKIYGILGIYHGTVPITIDYEKPVAQVFGDVVRNVAQESGKLYLRQFPRRSAHLHVPDLPSWTPDFVRDSIEYNTRFHKGVHEGGGWNATIYPTSCPSLLRTCGCSIDTVQSVFRFSQQTEPADVLSNFIGSHISMPHPTGATFLQALVCNIFQYPTINRLQGPLSVHSIRMFLHWILKCGTERGAFNDRFDNFVQEHNLADVFKSIPEGISTSLRFAKITGAIDHLVEPYKNAHDHSNFLRMTPQQRMASFWGSEIYPDSFLADMDWRVSSESTGVEMMAIKFGRWINNQAIIITEQGYTGFASHDASVGDCICIIAGCPWPTIIQPSGDHHKIVGGSYIFGLMNGELFKDRRLTNDRQKIFEFI